MGIVGEPVDKLFLWGHSSCTLHNSHPPKVLIFGGFGGLGRHARRNVNLMLDPLSGILEAITIEEPPSPRLGHTSSMIGESLFVIGGRCDPTKILNDVWVFNADKKKWALLKRVGVVFHPRHQHVAAVVGRKIYVFGGLRDEIACSSMHVLDTENSEWSEINVHGEWPCARHSHAMVANDSKYTCLEGMMARKHFGTFVKFRAGLNTISLLSITVGLPNVGPHFEIWNAGVLSPVMLNGLNEGRRDLTWQKWSYMIGLEGEALSLDTISGGSSVEWVDESAVTRKPPLTWYKGDAEYLRYHGLQEFDLTMHHLEEKYGFMTSQQHYISRKDEGDRIIVFERGDLVFVFNFHWTSSYSNY